MQEHEDECFDLSDSKRTDLRSDENNKKLIGLKDELNSQILTEFIALSPKCYDYRYLTLDTNEIKENKKAKGVSNVIVQKTLPCSVYINTLDTDKTVRREITGIRSFNLELFTTSSMKDCSGSYYDTMKMLNNIECNPFGYQG